LLVVAEIATAFALLVLGFVALHGLASSAQFMHRYVLVPIQGIDAALDDVGRLGRTPADRAGEAAIVHRIDEFARYYRNEIQVAGNRGPDARRQTAELQKVGLTSLIDEEQHVVASLQHGLERLTDEVGGAGVAPADLDAVRADLRALMRINLKFVDAAQDDITESAARTSEVLVLVGLAGIILAGVLGWRVRSAIAPRISALVSKVQKFREYGVHERTRIHGQDDIALLGNALEVGFSAIVERNRERERFLSVAAHELKTPMVSILGFVQAAMANPAESKRALEVIGRQTRRLAHLVEDLLWAASVRMGELPFHPVRLDVAQIARRVADEVGETVPSHPIQVHGTPSVVLLVDEPLFKHAVWSLLSYAILLSGPREPIGLDVEPGGARVSLTFQVHGSTLPLDDQVRIFEPFSTLQFEGDTRPRSAVGLFLCREIARVHGGSLRVSEQTGVGPVFTLELPA
jgi:signal transduction histidine kinase